jgi:hypothetical protein
MYHEQTIFEGWAMKITSRIINLIWFTAAVAALIAGITGITGPKEGWALTEIFFVFTCLMALMALVSFYAGLDRAGNCSRKLALLVNGLLLFGSLVLLAFGVAEGSLPAAVIAVVALVISALNVVVLPRDKGGPVALRLFKWTAAGAVVSAALFGLVWLLNVTLDEKLHPELAQFLEISVIPPDNNAYIVLLGLYAPEGKDPRSYGLQRVQEIETALHSNPDALGQQPADELKFKGDSNVLCNATNDLAACGKLDRVTVETMLASNTTLLQRYRKLLQYPVYQEMPIVQYETAMNLFNMPFPSYGGELQQLYQSELILLFRDGKRFAALQNLLADARFWAVVASDATNLLSKMIATSFLRRDIAVLSLLMQDKSFSTEEMGLARAVLATVTPEVLDVKQAMRGESRPVIMMLQVLPDYQGKPNALGYGSDWDFFPMALYQPGATANMLFEEARARQRLVGMTAPELLAYFSKPRDERNYYTPPAWWTANPINFTGRILIAIAVSDDSMANYAARVHNLDAYRRLVSLQLSLLEQGAGVEQIPDLLAQSPAELRNPYTGDAASWDAANHSLSFAVMARSINQENPLSETLTVDTGQL